MAANEKLSDCLLAADLTTEPISRVSMMKMISKAPGKHSKGQYLMVMLPLRLSAQTECV